MFPKISSMNRLSAEANLEMDLCSSESGAEVFMRGIRVPRQNLSEILEQDDCAVWTPKRGLPTMSS